MKDLIVIVGPTASGKTSLSIDIAKKCDGEIICADSRTIYKGMDIGTAKPTEKEQTMVQHWGLDLVEPSEYYSAAEFKDYATKKISEIRCRGKIPFLVGGSGLYIDSVIFDYKFGPKANKTQRLKLQHMSIDELHEYCKKNAIILPENYKNKRYLTRLIELNGAKSNDRGKMINNCIVVGISTENEVLRSRIKKRSNKIFKDGVIEEAKTLGDRYGWECEAMKSNIYPLIKSYINGVITLDELKNKFVLSDVKLAKRQKTWFKRNKFIKWMPIEDIENYLLSQLANNKNS